jgi:hypothetical protein
LTLSPPREISRTAVNQLALPYRYCGVPKVVVYYIQIYTQAEPMLLFAERSVNAQPYSLRPDLTVLMSISICVTTKILAVTKRSEFGRTFTVLRSIALFGRGNRAAAAAATGYHVFLLFCSLRLADGRPAAAGPGLLNM